MQRSERILIIEADSATLQLVKVHLEMEGFDVQVYRSGPEALDRYFDSRYDLVIVGRRQGNLSGLEVCRQLRVSDQHTPIIMLGALNRPEDVVRMLEAGADECVGIPFCIRELSARMKGILRLYRRAKMPASGRLRGERVEIDGLVLEDDLHRVSVANATVRLTAKEYDLLCLLASNPGKVFSRRLILDLLWDHDADVYEHTVDSHINRLRGKIESDPASPKYILTEWGLGYRFADQ